MVNTRIPACPQKLEERGKLKSKNGSCALRADLKRLRRKASRLLDPIARPWGFPTLQKASQFLIGCTCHVLAEGVNPKRPKDTDFIFNFAFLIFTFYFLLFGEVPTIGAF
jgi:hypothetical protein